MLVSFAVICTILLTGCGNAKLKNGEDVDIELRDNEGEFILSIYTNKKKTNIFNSNFFNDFIKKTTKDY